MAAFSSRICFISASLSAVDCTDVIEFSTFASRGTQSACGLLFYGIMVAESVIWVICDRLGVGNFVTD